MDLDAAQRRLDSRRAAAVLRARSTASPLAEVIGRIDPGETLAERIAALPRFACSRCGEEYTGEPYEGEICAWCWSEEQRRSVRRAAPKDRPAALAAAGVPERYRQPFEPPSAWPADPARGVTLAEWPGRCREFWAVLLIGPDYGAGKSMMAAEILWRMMQGGASGGWTRAGSLVASLYGRRGEEERAAAYRLEAAGVLVLDELGRAHTAEQTWETLGEFLSIRYDHLRPTIICTNLSREQLAGAEGALWDRLRDALIVPVLGESRRGGR